MAAAIVGKGGAAAVTSPGATWAYMTKVRNWSLDISEGTVNTTTFDNGDQWDEFAPDGQREFTGSYEAVIDDTALTTVPISGTMTFTFNLDATVRYVGVGFITRMAPGVSLGEEAIVTYEIRGTAALTPSAAA